VNDGGAAVVSFFLAACSFFSFSFFPSPTISSLTFLLLLKWISFPLRTPLIARVGQQLAMMSVACSARQLLTGVGVDHRVPLLMDLPPTQSMSLDRVDAAKSHAPERGDCFATRMEISARRVSFLCVPPKMVL
jgi:hypothetical protein